MPGVRKNAASRFISPRQETILWIILPLCLAGLVFVSAGCGTVRLTFREIVLAVFNLFGEEAAIGTRTGFILFQIRFPRILTAILVGSSLAVAGASLQGLFRNPMASPDLLGISAGGSLGAVTAINAGIAGMSILVLPVFAVAGAFVSASLIYILSTNRGTTSLLFIILAGMAISSMLNGIISLILLFSKEYEISQFLFWTMGGLENRRWEHILIAGPLLITGQVLIFLFAGDLNMFLYGEHNAHALGLPVETRKKIILAIAAVLAGVSVAVSGTIGFVGLLIPHLLRLLIGPDHRKLLPASALTGALFLLLCDTIGRSIVPPFEIRVGIVTALTGAPYFIYLIIRTQKRGLHG